MSFRKTFLAAAGLAVFTAAVAGQMLASGNPV